MARNETRSGDDRRQSDRRKLDSPAAPDGVDRRKDERRHGERRNED